MFDFSGKCAVVTGAGGAICGEIARELASAGAQVAIWDLSLAAAQSKADEINAGAAGKARAQAWDATDKESVAAALAATLRKVKAHLKRD